MLAFLGFVAGLSLGQVLSGLWLLLALVGSLLVVSVAGAVLSRALSREIDEEGDA